MLQIIFNELSSAELAQLPTLLQLEILSEFQLLPADLAPDKLSEKFGTLDREGRTYYRYRTKEYRIYFQRVDNGILIQRILHKNSLKDFFFRTSLPLGEDEELQKSPQFWKYLDEADPSKK